MAKMMSNRSHSGMPSFGGGFFFFFFRSGPSKSSAYVSRMVTASPDSRKQGLHFAVHQFGRHAEVVRLRS